MLSRRRDKADLQAARQFRLEEMLEDLTRLTQWRIVHRTHTQGWSKRNEGMWWCFTCGQPAPTQFDGPGSAT